MPAADAAAPVNRYGTLAARVYDLDKPVGLSFGDIEYYRERLRSCTGPVLEPAAGNGRVLVPLLEAGIEMHGFDASREMLELCKAACRSRGLAARLSLQRLESFAFDQSFAAIILPAGSFQLLADADAARAVLARFRRHLLPGGRLILDLDPVDAVLAPPAAIRQWQDSESLLTLGEQRIATDRAAQTVTSLLCYEERRHGRLVAAETETFTLRWWDVPELGLALREAGFTRITVCGSWHHGRPPTGGDTSITFEAS